MTLWMAATLAFCLALVPCAALALFAREPIDRLCGLEMAGAQLTLALICFAEANQHASFLDLGLTLALLSFGGGLVFARHLKGYP